MELGDCRNALVIGLLTDLAMLQLVLEDPFPLGTQFLAVLGQGPAYAVGRYEVLVLPLATCKERVILGDLQVSAVLLVLPFKVLHTLVQ